MGTGSGARSAARSPSACRRCAPHTVLRYRTWRSDVVGSPYCVRDYVVDERFGGPDGLVTPRQRLAERDLALILDYVPNHVAADHPWVTHRPDYFLAGRDAELAAHPEEFMETAGGVFAKGRDPYFEPWQDVLQLNAFSPALREAAAETVDRDWRSVRRSALRHGDADDQRGVRAHMGRAGWHRP